MREEKVEFYSEGQKIAGILHIPDIKNPSAIIMVHGLGGFVFDEPFKDVAENLCKNGFEVLRFAFRGYEKGNFTDLTSLNGLTIPGEISDLKAAIDFIEKQNINKIGLMTESFGGTIAVLLNDFRIKAMFLMAPTIYLKDTLSPIESKEKFGEKFLEEVYEIDRIEESKIKSIKCPVMISHGSDDKEVNPKQSKELFKILNKPKEFVLLKNIKHMLTRNLSTRKKIIQLSLDWFNKWLK